MTSCMIMTGTAFNYGAGLTRGLQLNNKMKLRDDSSWANSIGINYHYQIYLCQVQWNVKFQWN